MKDYSRPLGDTVKHARNRLKLTQCEVAESIGVDSRTILNIENYKGNPKMEVLHPLVRTLKIDAREIFTPEILRDSPALRQLRIMIEDCNEQEASAIIPAVRAILEVLRNKDARSING